MNNLLKSTYANRGKSLEDLINYANEQYKTKGVALIQKVATPWTVKWVGGKIITAFPAEKSTVDFIGLAGGRPIAFDAKQCQNKNGFPLKNIKLHQMEFLLEWDKQGGESFFLIEMVAIEMIFKLSLESMNYYFTLAKNGGSKSVKVKQLTELGIKIKPAGGIVLDYLGLY